MSCVINASDFNPNTKDPLRDRWAGADMAAVVKALNGRKAAITTDRMTGCTVQNATLERVEGDRVLVKTSSNPGGTWYPLVNCGMVLPTENEITDSTKWDALQIFRDEQREAHSAALAWAEERRGAKTWGSVTTRACAGRGMHSVTYEPCDNPPEGRVPGSKFTVVVRVTDGQGQVVRCVADYTELDARRAAHQERMTKIREFRDRGEEVPAELLRPLSQPGGARR